MNENFTETLFSLFGRDPALGAFVAVTTVTYAVFLRFFMRRMKDRKVGEEKKFINAVSNGISNGVITNFSDVENIYKGVRKISSSDDEYNKARLATWLRVYLLSGIERISEKSDADKFVKIKDQISTFIEKAEKESPHALLPELERSIIRDIESYLESNNSSSVKRKIDELSTAIQIREESLGKLQNTTKWSVPLSVFGLVLTVIFGILSLN